MKGRRLKLRLFIEGEETDISSATIQISEGQPVSAAIQVVPTDEGFALKPRTTIHLFMRSDYQDQPAFSNVDDDRHYEEIFCGEYISSSFRKMADHRQLSLNCADFSLYWDTCYQYFMGVLGVNRVARFTGSGTDLFGAVFKGHQSVISGLLKAGAKSGPRTPGLDQLRGTVGGIVRVLEAMGGVISQSSGVNDFFTIAEARLRIMHQIGSDSGLTAQQMFSTKTWWAWLEGRLGNAGQLVSFRDMLHMIMGLTDYGVYPNPAPYYRDMGTVTRKSTAGAKYLIYDPKLVQVESKLDNLLPTMDSYIEAAVSDPETFGPITSTVDDIATILNAVIPRISGFPETAKIMQDLTELHQAVANQVSTSSVITPMRQAKISAAQLGQDVKALRAALRAPTKIVFDTNTTRMITQIFAPNLWFCPPPRCNVFFPDMYGDLSYQRQHLREITRYNLTTARALIGPDELLDKHYYAPWDVDEGIVMGRGLLEHEIYTGIVPQMERLSSLEFFGSSSSADGGQAAIGKNKLDYPNILTHNNFFKKRFASRTMTMSGRPETRSVVGMPALIILDGWNGVGTPPDQLVGKLVQKTLTVSQKGGQTEYTFSYVRNHKGDDDDYLNTSFYGLESRNKEGLTEYLISAKDVEGVLNGTIASTTVLKDQAKAELAFSALDIITGELEDEVNRRPKDPEGGNIETTQYGFDDGKVKGINGGWIVSVEVTNWDKVTVTRSFNVGGDIADDGEQNTNQESLEMLSEVRVWETTSSTYKAINTSVALAFEEAMLTKKYDKSYDPGNIGKKFYQPNYGCDSVVDMSTFEGKTLTELKKEGVLKDSDFYRDKKTIRLSTAANLIANMYYQAPTENRDVFIDAFTSRPVASLEDVMGKLQKDGTRTGGFHTEAVSGKKGLEGLGLGSPLPSEARRGESPSVNPENDPRPGRKDAAKAYKESLNRLAKLE